MEKDTKEYDARLEDWTEYEVGDRSANLRGTIMGDSKGRFFDGEIVNTSSYPMPTTPHKEGDIVQTRNTKYLLGKQFLRPNEIILKLQEENQILKAKLAMYENGPSAKNGW